MLLLEDRRFYVYVLLDPRKPGKYKYGEFEFDYEPFYVGKGHHSRSTRHIYEAKIQTKQPRNIHNYRKIRNILSENKEPKIVYVNDLTDKNALQLEIKMIKTIGRYNDKNGPLTNMTLGGDGAAGRVCSEETKNKMRIKLKGRVVPLEQRQKISKSLKGRQLTDFQRESIIKSNKTRKVTRKKGWKHSEETKEKMSISRKRFHLFNENLLKGKKHTEQSRNKISKALQGKKHDYSPFKGKVHTEESKNRISQTMKLYCLKNPKKISTKTKSKLSNSLKLYYLKNPKKVSEETKIKMSESAKNRKNKQHENSSS